MAACRSTIERKTPRLSRRLVSAREEGLDRVQPGARGRGEVEDEARMAGEPAQHLGVLVGGVVVEDDVDHLAGRHARARWR